jgi:hypothetical protein
MRRFIGVTGSTLAFMAIVRTSAAHATDWEATKVLKDPTADNTDVYAITSGAQEPPTITLQEVLEISG